jgi:hypothetical protein
MRRFKAGDTARSQSGTAASKNSKHTRRVVTLVHFAVFLLSMTISCEDYDERFDDLNSSIEQLAAENAALEAQIAALQGASASGAQATAAKLAEFQDAVTAIIASLSNLAGANAAAEAAIADILDALSDLADLVASNSATNEELAEAIALIEAMLDDLNTNVLHHSGGGSTDDDGSTSDDHHSGGGSTDDGGSDSDDHHSGGGSTDDGGSTSDDHHSGGGSSDDGGSTSDDHHSGGGSTDDGGSTSTATDNGDSNLDLYVTVPAGTTSVRIVGPWWNGWDPNAGPVGTDMGDGTFKFTFDPAPTANMEYKYLVDGTQEDITTDAAAGDCTERIDAGMMITDYANYGNRIWLVGSGDQAETAGGCSIDTVD